MKKSVSNLSEEDIELKAIAVVIMAVLSANELTIELIKNNEELSNLQDKDRDEIRFISAYVLFFKAQEVFLQNIIKNKDISEKFEKFTFHYFKHFFHVDALIYIKDMATYIKKIGKGGEIQYLGSKICRYLGREDSILMLRISSIYALYLKHKYYVILDIAWKMTNEEIKKLISKSDVNISI